MHHEQVGCNGQVRLSIQSGIDIYLFTTTICSRQSLQRALLATQYVAQQRIIIFVALLSPFLYTIYMR